MQTQTYGPISSCRQRLVTNIASNNYDNNYYYKYNMLSNVIMQTNTADNIQCKYCQLLTANNYNNNNNYYNN